MILEDQHSSGQNALTIDLSITSKFHVRISSLYPTKTRTSVMYCCQSVWTSFQQEKVESCVGGPECNEVEKCEHTLKMCVVVHLICNLHSHCMNDCQEDTGFCILPGIRSRPVPIL